MQSQRIRSAAHLIVVLAMLVCSADALAPSYASAHSVGSSWEVPAGNYVADVGYDPTTFVAGEYTLFDLNLKKAKGQSDPVPFTEVWVRIKSADDTYLAAGVRKQPIGPTTLLYLFAKPGDYSLEVSFRDADSNEIAAASFPVTVTGGTDATPPYGWMAAGALALVVAGMMFSNIRNARKS